MALAVALCLALAVWKWHAPVLKQFGSFLIDSEAPERADLILVLGGFEGPRVVKGAELGIHAFAPRVLLSGPIYEGRPESDMAIEFLVKKGYPRELFVGFPHHATSTIDEAQALAPELRRLGVRSVILVTRGSHSRRATIVFRLFCAGVYFRSIPASDEQFQADGWWANPRWRKIFFLEWSKILGTVLMKYPAYLLRELATRGFSSLRRVTLTNPQRQAFLPTLGLPLRRVDYTYW
jgi:uncharacterized SAM-binding protein YcdF (DUF218 family)